MSGKNGTGSHVSNYTPLVLYNNKRKGVGVRAGGQRGGDHMATLYSGPAPLMGKASEANLRRSISVDEYVMNVCVHVCGCVHVAVCMWLRACMCMCMCMCMCLCVYVCVQLVSSSS